MEDYSILAEGPFSSLEVEYTGQEWMPSSEHNRKMLSEYMQDWLVVKNDEGKRTDNGNYIGVESFYREGDTLNIVLHDTDYFSHVATRELELTDSPNTLGLTGRLLTSDGYIVLGEKSGLNEIGENDYTMPAGMAEGFDLEDSMYREVREELNVGEEDISTVSIPGMVYALNHPNLVYSMETDLEFQEVVEGWNDIDGKELSSIAGIPLDNVESALNGEENILIADGERTESFQNSFALRPHTRAAFDII